MRTWMIKRKIFFYSSVHSSNITQLSWRGAKIAPYWNVITNVKASCKNTPYQIWLHTGFLFVPGIEISQLFTLLPSFMQDISWTMNCHMISSYATAHRFNERSAYHFQGQCLILVHGKWLMWMPYRYKLLMMLFSYNPFNTLKIGFQQVYL